MKILHVTKKYPNALGGDAIVVQNLEKQQTKNGHKVFILTTNCDEIINKKNLTKFGLKDTPSNLDKITFRRILSLIKLYFKSFKLLREIKPDIVHSHSVDMGYVMSFACRKYGIKLFHTCHGVTFNDKQYSIIKRGLDKFFLKHSNFKYIITVDFNSLIDFEKEHIENVVYIPNGVNIPKINNKHINSKNIKFIFVGRLEDQKGLNYLIDAVKEVIKSNKDFEILLIGEGSKRKELQKQINNLRLGNYFNFLGSKTNEEVMNYYSKSNVFILLSIWEGLPITLLEAMSFGLPVIVTDVGGISKVCTNNKDALIISSKNTEAIKDAMIKLIENKELRKKLGENGRKLVEQKYTWEKVEKDVEKVYRSVLR